MADDVTLNSMSGGSVVATDDSGTGHVQLVKLAYSADGSRTHVDADTDGLKVKVSNATVTVALGSALPAGSNVIGGVTQSGTWNIGSITTLPALPTGSNVIGGVTQSGTWTVTPAPGLYGGTLNTGYPSQLAGNSSWSGSTLGVGALGVRNDNAATSFAAMNNYYSPIAVDAVGAVFTKSRYRPTPYKLISAATTNATSVSATANTLLFGYYISNTNSSVRYVKFYNKASAPTVGTDTPVLVLAIPGTGAANVSFSDGINFTTGLAFATTTGAADSDTGAVAANEIIVNLVYATY